MVSVIKTTLVIVCCLLIPLSLKAQLTNPVSEGDSATLYEIDDAQIQSALLFYRVEGSRQFMQLPLLKQGSKWSVTFKGQQLTPPGLEYYIQLTFKDGKIKTEPESYPKYNPFRLVVNKKQSVNIQLAQPSIEPGQDIEFKVAGYVDAAARVFIGDMDVTDFVQRDDSRWVLNNDNNLFDGDQQLQLVSAEGQTLATQSVSFIDPSARAARERQLVLRGNASLNIGGQTDSESNDNDALALNGNLHIETEYNQGDFKSNFSGINVNYQRGAEDEFNLSSGFVFNNSYRNHSLELGDVSVSGTPLVLSGFSRRGMLASTEGDSFSGSFFNVRTSTVDGWESGLSFDDRQTYGVAVERRLGKEGKTNIQFSVISGELQQADATIAGPGNVTTSNVGSSNNNPQAGDSAGLVISTELAGTTISAEVAGSRFDGNTSDATDALTDEAYELSLSRDIYGLASSLGYHHYGANYATIANPNFSNDREGLNLSLGSGWRFLNWSTSFSTTKDNIEKDPGRPIVTSNNTGLNLGFIIEHWPSINVGVNFSNQQSSDEPAPDQRIDNQGQDVTLGLSDSYGPYNLSWSSSIGELESKLDPGNDSETENHALTLGFNATAVDLNLNLSQNESRSDISLNSKLVNLSANFPLFSHSITLNSQFSVQDNSASDNSQNNRIVGGSARVSWRMKDMFSSVTSKWADTQFGLSWTYNKTTDDLDSSLNSSDNIVMLEFSLGAPVNFEYDWQF
jgi:hypothetical protein